MTNITNLLKNKRETSNDYGSLLQLSLIKIPYTEIDGNADGEK